MNINDKIFNFFLELVKTKSDINEHLATLLEYASKCEHITELGSRWMVSTYSFVLGKPKTMISVDLHHPSKWDNQYNTQTRFEDIKEFCANNDINYKFIQGNTLNLNIDTTDLLFIDTFHIYKQLKKELELHGNKAKKYIIFHDTTTYGSTDEDSGDEQIGINNEDIFIGLENKTGLNPAINEFLDANPQWSIEKIFENCNGLTILKRK